MRLSRDSIAAIVATAAFLLVVSLGFWRTRGPSSQRLFRADEKRVQNLYQLANEINRQYKERNQQLPEGLSDLQKTRFADPITRKPPVYSPKPPSSYTLCATFAVNSPKNDSNETFVFWTHPAGAKCFEFDAKGQMVPQAPYSYY